MESAIKELIELCRYAAQHPRFVQGPGGNCSVKFSGQMVIKASGYFLEDVSEQEGHVLHNSLSRPVTEGRRRRVSMETPLHELLGAYVIHTHSIVAGALVCARQGKEVFQQIFKDSHYQWMDYAAPGRCLFERAKTLLMENPMLSGERIVLFLQNHGLVVSTPTKESCIELHEDTIRRLELFFGTAPIKQLPSIPEGCYLTPDHAVYTQGSPNGLFDRQKTTLREIRRFVQQVIGLIEKMHWTPAWLSGPDVAFLLKMDEEKYRQTLWGKAQ